LAVLPITILAGQGNTVVYSANKNFKDSSFLTYNISQIVLKNDTFIVEVAYDFKESRILAI